MLAITTQGTNIHPANPEARGGSNNRWRYWQAWLVCAVISCGWSLSAQTTKTLLWNPSQDTTGYRVFASMGTAPFSEVANVNRESTPVLVSTNVITRFYVTAYNTAGESGPSETVTNTPAPPPTGAIITLVAPGLSTTNLLIGQSLNLSALIQNTGDQSWDAVDGALTLLPPGANRGDGLNVDVTAIIPPFTVGAKSSRAVAGTWAAPPGALTGIWASYLVVKQVDGVWLASPFSYFTMSTMPTNTPPAAPTGLRFGSVSATRADLLWTAGDRSLSTEVQRATDNATFQRIAVVTAGVERFSDTRLSRKKRYVWRVRHPTSDYSNTVAREPM
jgi:hypothetical protein